MPFALVFQRNWPTYSTSVYPGNYFRQMESNLFNSHQLSVQTAPISFPPSFTSGLRHSASVQASSATRHPENQQKGPGGPWNLAFRASFCCAPKVTPTPRSSLSASSPSREKPRIPLSSADGNDLKRVFSPFFFIASNWCKWKTDAGAAADKRLEWKDSQKSCAGKNNRLWFVCLTCSCCLLNYVSDCIVFQNALVIVPKCGVACKYLL